MRTSLHCHKFNGGKILLCLGACPVRGACPAWPAAGGCWAVRKERFIRIVARDAMVCPSFKVQKHDLLIRSACGHLPPMPRRPPSLQHRHTNPFHPQASHRNGWKQLDESGPAELLQEVPGKRALDSVACMLVTAQNNQECV